MEDSYTTKKPESVESLTPFFTLLSREVKHFLDNISVTVAPPILTPLLYVIVFGIVVGSRVGETQGFPYLTFMFPGLVMMSVIMNSYMNPGWSLFEARRRGRIKPILSSPLSYSQMVLAFIVAGVFRGLLVGILLSIVGLGLPVGVTISEPIHVISFMVVVAFLFASSGTIVGLWAKEWDYVASIMTYAINPLVFLGGIFYSVEMVESVPILGIFVKLNPVTHMVNGLRYGMIGMSELNTELSLAMLAIMSAIFFAVGVSLFVRGYNLRV